MCPSCQYENELERVYCHSCGHKLDRSVLPKQSEQAKAKEAESVRRMLQPKEPIARYVFIGLSRAVLFGAILAALILMALPPNTPEPSPQNEDFIGSTLGTSLENLVLTQAVSTLTVTEEMLNHYLGARVRSRPQEIFTIEFDTPLVLAKLDEDEITVFSKRTVNGLPYYLSASYTIQSEQDAVSAKLQSGGFGRLKIPGLLMQLLEGYFFGNLWSALDQEIKMLGRLQKADLTEGQAILQAR